VRWTTPIHLAVGTLPRNLGTNLASEARGEERIDSRRVRVGVTAAYIVYIIVANEGAENVVVAVGLSGRANAVGSTIVAVGDLIVYISTQVVLENSGLHTWALQPPDLVQEVFAEAIVLEETRAW
jgi:hypothetical protein